MTAPTNTMSTLTNIGQREDLEDKIYRVAPEETPFTSNIGSVNGKARTHEWQTETLAAPVATNAQLEGDDYTAAAGNLTTRLKNIMMISAAAFTISRSSDIVETAGRSTETNRMKGIRGLEVRRDFEMRAIGNYASVEESGATTRKSAGALAWLTSNDSRGGGAGADGGYSGGLVSAATNGTQRTFTEALFKTCMSNLFTSRGGGKRTYQAYMSGTHKQQFSAFTGIAAIRKDAPGNSMATIIGAADTYVSDFGDVALIPHPYGLTRDCFICDPDMWAVATLDGMSTRQLGATGDATKWLITMEKCLVSRNEKASAVVADLS
jgi:hypothetical protein